MSKLFIFGDSFSDTFHNTKNVPWIKQYISWKGYVPESFGDIISKTLKLELINKSVSGSDNYSIFENICKCATIIQPDDVLIIGWTGRHRFRIADDRDLTWKNVSSVHINNIDTISHIMSKDTLLSIFANRDSILYLNEVNNWIHLLNTILKNNKIIHWTWMKNQTELHALTISDLPTILDETNGELNDMHYNEHSQTILAEMFLSELKKDKPNKLI